MDFTLTESQQAVADLAAQVLTGPDPWKALAQAGLLDVSPPDGLGGPEVTVLLTGIGRRAPTMKALSLTGALARLRWGRPVPGEMLLTAAIREPSHPAPDPPATALANGKLTSTKIGVPYAAEAHLLSEDFGRVTVADRRHAAANPHAWFYQRPVTLAEHQASRWIAEPLRLLDCCQESDGAVAVVVTSLDRARDLPHPPRVVRAAAQGAGPDQFTMTSYYRDDLTGLPQMGLVAAQVWEQAGIGPADVRTPCCTTTSPPTCSSSSRSSASAGAARPGTSSPTAPSRWAGACRSTRTAASWATPTSTA